MNFTQKTSYTLSGMTDPTDRQLASLMKGVAENARIKSDQAYKTYIRKIGTTADSTFKDWESRIKLALTENPFSTAGKDKNQATKSAE